MAGPSFSLGVVIPQFAHFKEKIDESDLEACKRTRRMLVDTEEIGNTAVQELYRQHEKLVETEDRLDGMTTSLKATKKQVQGMKGVLGGIRNLFHGPESIPSTPNSSLMPPVSKLSRRKSTGEIFQSRQNDRLTDENIQLPAKVKGAHSSQDVNQKLDDNLKDIAFSLARLKEQSLGMRAELDGQRPLFSRVLDKTKDNIHRTADLTHDLAKINKK